MTEGPDQAYSVHMLDDDCNRRSVEIRLATVDGVRFLDVRGEDSDNPAVPVHFFFLNDEDPKRG